MGSFWGLGAASSTRGAPESPQEAPSVVFPDRCPRKIGPLGDLFGPVWRLWAWLFGVFFRAPFLAAFWPDFEAQGLPKGGLFNPADLLFVWVIIGRTQCRHFFKQTLFEPSPRALLDSLLPPFWEALGLHFEAFGASFSRPFLGRGPWGSRGPRPVPRSSRGGPRK